MDFFDFSPWPAVVIPSFVLALIIRIDAKLLGPYFSFSELVSGFGFNFLIFQRSTRAALIRRLLYPILIGFICSILGVYGASLAAVGALAAVLLIWPVVFHGLPVGVSRRALAVPLLYVSLFVSYGGLTLLGGYIAEVMRRAGEGDIWVYVQESFVNWALTALVILFFTTFGRGAQARLDRRRGHDDV
ncbi:hypothetical protein E8P82_14185 [Arthrobacter echini]|uniref:Uncharacterized protein n=1 Tax=Arthrobacter echini TaxID=1529066 RepID=A0A4V3Z5A8_9MICC|nr:hypothetical protein [Arthrobacter echini]THJ64769.1 hypothetical protein E8P82_14185 [Arthrobacter echini]